jgi:hypothetical protein
MSKKRMDLHSSRPSSFPRRMDQDSRGDGNGGIKSMAAKIAFARLTWQLVVWIPTFTGATLLRYNVMRLLGPLARQRGSGQEDRARRIKLKSSRAGAP